MPRKKRIITKPYKNNKLGLLGVVYDKVAEGYRAQITVNKKQMSLGVYETAEIASDVYQQAVKFYGVKPE